MLQNIAFNMPLLRTSVHIFIITSSPPLDGRAGVRHRGLSLNLLRLCSHSRRVLLHRSWLLVPRKALLKLDHLSLQLLLSCSCLYEPVKVKMAPVHYTEVHPACLAGILHAHGIGSGVGTVPELLMVTVPLIVRLVSGEVAQERAACLLVETQ